MMPQGLLPYKYHKTKKSSGLTAFAGLMPYLDLAYLSGLIKSIERHVNARSGHQGWSDREMLLSLILLNIAGGDVVNDINRLESDAGLCKFYRWLRKRADAFQQDKSRWRKPSQRLFPSATAIFDYLRHFLLVGTKNRKLKKRSFFSFYFDFD